jgi:hypothetical protein
MTRTISVVVITFLLCVGLFAQASGQAPAAQPAQTFGAGGIMDRLKDPQQAKQLQQALDILQQVANTKAADTKGDGDHKTVGDALDKGLDMAKETVIYLAGKIEQVAPQLWRVLVIQQYVKGAMSLINPFGFLLVVLLYRHLVLKWWKPLPSDDDPAEPIIDKESDENPFTHKGWRGVFTIVIPLVMLVIGGVWLYSSITDAAGYFINPNYYALKDIIGLVRSPGAF